jgi:hypothetical protein
VQTKRSGGLTAIITTTTTILVGREDNFDIMDFNALIKELNLPDYLAPSDWDYAESDDLVIWSITHPPVAA